MLKVIVNFEQTSWCINGSFPLATAILLLVENFFEILIKICYLSTLQIVIDIVISSITWWFENKVRIEGNIWGSRNKELWSRLADIGHLRVSGGRGLVDDGFIETNFLWQKSLR